MRELAGAEDVARLIQKLAAELASGLAVPVAADPDPARDSRPPTATQSPLAIVGVKRRGDQLARRLADALLQPAASADASAPGLQVDHVGSLDITLYRDDLSEVGAQPIVRTTDIDFPLDGARVVLVDDVLMTGRSVRAALQSLLDIGRPQRVWLAVLVDRGGRELPVAPDFVGLDLMHGQFASIDPSQRIEVRLAPDDDHDAILLTPPPPADAELPLG